MTIHALDENTTTAAAPVSAVRRAPFKRRPLLLRVALAGRREQSLTS
jgi:hypothetical protein